MRMTMPKLNSVLVATRATVIRLEEERDALVTAGAQPDGVDSGRAPGRLCGRAQRCRGRRAAAAAASHRPGRARRNSWPRLQKRTKREAVRRRAQGQAQGRIETSQRALKERQKAQVMKSRGRRDRRAAVLRRRVDRRQVSRADQTGGRRVESGCRSGDRRHRYTGDRAGSHGAEAESGGHPSAV